MNGVNIELLNSFKVETTVIFSLLKSVLNNINRMMKYSSDST